MQAVSEMHSSTALFFHEPPQVPGASGKIYEYLTSRRPVLCAAHPDNVGYRLIDELGAGECADVRDPAQVEAALERLVLRWKQGALTPLTTSRDEAPSAILTCRSSPETWPRCSRPRSETARAPPPVRSSR